MTAHATPQAFVAYAPQGPGLRCAMLYFAAGEDLWGWYIGPMGKLLVADYFQVAGFHALREPRYEAVDIAGMHGRWVENRAMCRELARMQEQFARDWLVYGSAGEARAELASYERAGLAAGEVNLRFARLAELSRTLPEWTYTSPAFEPAVLTWLAARWALDYRPAPVAVRQLNGGRSGVIEMNADRFERDARGKSQHTEQLSRR